MRVLIIGASKGIGLETTRQALAAGYDVRAQACHVFEGVAALAWQCLDGDGSIDDILTDFADIFEVDLELVQQDLVPLFTDGFEKELIVENQND